ncbi:putative RNA recognition motif-containing protein [Neospora caninum Liverpool]|uniref:Putative RNA recognition motif-containing protein n=1 Tax=Neospora caninum (strain Liverpool) TaxID=572307 RepID=F0VIL2_NEOCL|nr:putative RNA recognition motif-containing protein [Neospora caninum Liverpool]CBZ53573.1 putative RNA recognition motif-containing protein [Neospora caninum Liverpool]CEL67561.1 TPA: RNA recognition motif-containing protein,putative [Neospora caninum Liverpool]|eukprot:XP_003883605.1 putative RNA recognition motif-containing protein [Neospora caninum Liverpool]
MDSPSHNNGASNRTNDASRDPTECLAEKELLETADLRNPLSAQSTNSFTGGDVCPFSPAVNYSFHSEDSRSAAQSFVMSLSSTSFASIASATCSDEKELSPEHKTGDACSSEHPTAPQQARALQERHPEEHSNRNEKGIHKLYLPEALTTISTKGDASLRAPQRVQKSNTPLPSKFFETDYPIEGLLSLLLRKDQEPARMTGSDNEKKNDTSGHTSMHSNFVALQGTDPSAAGNIFMTGDTRSVRPSPAVRYENKECIVSEFSRLWKGNKCLGPQEVSDGSGGPAQDNRTHIPFSLDGTERENTLFERSKGLPNPHAIVLDEESLFKDLAAAWDLDVTEESAADRHGRAARHKQQSGSHFENRYGMELCTSSQNLHMTANSPDSCTFPNCDGTKAPPADIGIPEFLGRRRTFPGGEVGKMDFTQDIKYLPSCVVRHESNQDSDPQRRYSGPFALPPLPSDEVLSARDVWCWHGTESFTREMPAAPYLEGSCSQMSSFQAGDISAEQATTPTDLNTSGKHDTSTTSSRSGGLAKYTLIVNVPPMTTRQDLHMTFSAFGKVELTVVVCDKDHRHPHREWTATSGYAFVRFSSSAEAAAAVAAAAVGSIRMRGSRIRATWAKKDSLAKHSQATDSSCVSCSGSMGTEYFGNGGPWQPGTPFAPLPTHQTLPPPPEEPHRLSGVSPAAPLRQSPGAGNLEHCKVPVAACLTPQSAQDFACRLCRIFIAFDPVLLPCWHMCCSDCVQQCFRWQPNHPTEPVVVDCPECGTVSPASAIKKIDEADSGLLLRLRQLKDSERVCCPFVPLCCWTGRATSFVSHTYSHMMADGGLFDGDGYGNCGPAAFSSSLTNSGSNHRDQTQL